MLGIVVLLAAYFLLETINLDCLQSDEGLYAWLGERVFADPKLIVAYEVTHHQPPLFALLVALARFVFSAELAARSVTFVFYLLGIFLIYDLGTRIKNTFAGLLAAIFLAFNYYYLGYGAMILADVPLTCVLLGIAILLWDLLDSKVLSWSRVWWLGILSCAALGLKWAGVVVVPWMLLLIVIGTNHIRKSLRLVAAGIPLILSLGLLLFLSLNNFWQGAQAFPASPTRIFFDGEKFMRYVGESWRVMGQPDLRWLFFGGLVALVWERRFVRIFLLSWWIMMVVVNGLIVPEPDPRYHLVFLPGLLLVIALGIERAAQWLERLLPIGARPRRLVIFGLVLIGCVLYTSRALAQDRSKGEIFVGYADAGALVKNIIKPDTMVFAGSERQLRYYSGINYEEFKGQLIRLRHSQKQFQERLATISSDVVVVVDRWETLTPDWVNRNSLSDLGFNLIQTVWAPAWQPRFQRVEIIPVVWIYLKSR